MEKWVQIIKGADFDAIGRQFSIHPLTARLIRNRDVIGDETIDSYLNGSTDNLHSPFLLKDMERADAILNQKIAGGAKIRVVGDYDVDGIMASYILTEGLRALDACVDLVIPDRIRDGFGMNVRLVEEAAADGIDTIVTCDNGISASEAVLRAKSLGMTVIITDHHTVVSVPTADAVIDPAQEDCPYPYKLLCGASVAWKLVTALGTPDPMQYLPFAAFATVGDVVDLTGENRIIVKEGLKALRETKNLGLLKLCSACGILPEQINAFRIGFVLGPCFNAGGRLEHAEIGYRLLSSKDEREAEACAVHLHELNEKRKVMTEEAVIRAEEFLEGGRGTEDKVYVIPLTECHESIAGIVAGRIREKYGHPTILLVKTESGMKGSGRSTENYSMIEELVKCADLLTRYGGHPMAAGLTLPEEKVEALRIRLNKNCTLTPEDFLPLVRIDLAFPPSAWTEELIDELSLLEPYGKGNERPLFAARGVGLSNVTILGASRNVIRMNLRDAYGNSSGIRFRASEEERNAFLSGKPLDLVYYPSINEFRGARNIQIVVEHWRFSKQ